MLASALPMALLGCGTLLPSAEFPAPPANLQANSKAESLFAVTNTIALGTITGPPPSVSKREIEKLDAAFRSAKLPLLNYQGARGDFTLQGELQATRQKDKTKVVYNWQLFDRTSGWMGGVAGIEIVPAKGADAWGDVTEPVLEAIAEQAAAAVTRRARLGKPATIEAAALNSQIGQSDGPFLSVMQTAPPAQARMIDGHDALRRVNEYRASKGLLPLTLDGNLMIAALILATEMAKHDQLSHSGPNGASLNNRLTAAGYNFALAAENVGAGQNSLAEMIEEWKRNPEQSSNLLLPEAKQMGIGFQYRPHSKFKTYWALVVAAPP